MKICGLNSLNSELLKWNILFIKVPRIRNHWSFPIQENRLDIRHLNLTDLVAYVDPTVLFSNRRKHKYKIMVFLNWECHPLFDNFYRIPATTTGARRVLYKQKIYDQMKNQLLKYRRIFRSFWTFRFFFSITILFITCAYLCKKILHCTILHYSNENIHSDKVTFTEYKCPP